MQDSFTDSRWIRLPTKGRCPCTGLSRAAFYDLIKKGAVKTASLRKPGALTCIRLVWLPSVMAYIEHHVESEVAQ